MRYGILHRFDYDGKTESVKIADSLLTLPRFAFGGKIVDCYKLDRRRATFFESRLAENHLHIVVLKVAAIAGCILGSPLFLVAIGLKGFDAANQKVIERFCKRSKNDKFYKRPWLGNDFVSRMTVRIFMKYMGLDNLTASMQIQGDKILKAFSPGDYDGGIGLPIAEILTEKLLPYCMTTEQTDFSTACFKAQESLVSFQDISEKMIPIMISRFFPIGWIFNRRKHTRHLAEDLKDDLKRLKRNHIIMIPLTFYSPSQGYRTVVTSFTYKGNKEYDWRIYRANVGAEGKVHACILKKGRVPGIRLRSLTTKQVANIDFLTKLIELGTFQKYDQGEKFFQFVKEFEHNNDNVKFSKNIRTIRQQETDLYSIRSLNFALKDIMGKDNYKQFHYLMRLDNLIELKKAIDSNAISNPEKLADANTLLTMATDDMKNKIRKIEKLFGLREDQKEVLSQNSRRRRSLPQE